VLSSRQTFKLTREEELEASVKLKFSSLYPREVYLDHK
jgi:hypothetical protein